MLPIVMQINSIKAKSNQQGGISTSCEYRCVGFARPGSRPTPHAWQPVLVKTFYERPPLSGYVQRAALYQQRPQDGTTKTL
ncbi:hypothetical protein E2C01_027415 [Portunus trituberculatus]|uniref:Uncharacterized protein n=1 Tax=Portunus trituberculatus TaxID=210409 RepID=A0A5B7ELW4_PORTR|nr:hypothetical protein [Portunus trituberculatus]